MERSSNGAEPAPGIVYQPARDDPSPRVAAARAPWTAFVLASVVVVAGLIALPAQMAAWQRAVLSGSVTPAGLLDVVTALPGVPAWLSDLASRPAPLSFAAWPLRVAIHQGPIHALLVTGGLWLIGSSFERRFGARRTLVLFLVGCAVSLAAAANGSALGLLGDDAAPMQLAGAPWPVGAAGGVYALFGGLMLDIARRGESRSLFGPLIAPILLHGAIGMLVPLDWSLVHGTGFAAGAILMRLLTPRDGSGDGAV